MSNQWEVRHGDCLELLRAMPDNSVDAVVTDPPYGLSFMGKKWDYDVPAVEVWAECLRVLKPGGHLLAFAGTRTQHRMAVRIEDAGFEIRDMIAWVYGSGFPKSLDVSKAIDKAAGAEREVLAVVDPRGTFDGRERGSSAINTNWRDAEGRSDLRDLSKKEITAPATPDAERWQGWGTALKPALEPITVARKPLEGTVAENVLEHGTGAINVDGCRVAGVPLSVPQPSFSRNMVAGFGASEGRNGQMSQASGRWPANLIHDGSDEVVGLFPVVKAGVAVRHNSGGNTFGGSSPKPPMENIGYNDTGSAARFFYCAKSSSSERNKGLEGFEVKPLEGRDPGQDAMAVPHKTRSVPTANVHPTVKPIALMRYLCRLVTPPGGTVLDPFTGSGTTGIAAKLEGFHFIGCEREAEYVAIARARIDAWEQEQEEPQQPTLFDPEPIPSPS